jgi:S-adenosylmethionine-diacylglycerol 3-amino-3-carboxypropyl transferase
LNKEDLLPAKKVDFSILRYAGCWEDADVLLEGLNPKPGSRILSICSGGDNCLALLSTNPAEVTAVDISKVQLHMLALKKACFEKLPYKELLGFLGIHSDKNRWDTYLRFRDNLPEDSKAYWNVRREEIEKGVVYSGKFERYLGYFSRTILPLIHGRKKVKKLFQSRSAAEQEKFYRKQWNTWRWKLFFKVFFSRYVMGKFGRDPQFLKEVQLSVHDFIYAKAEKHLSSTKAQENYFLQFILQQKFDTGLPFYLRAENFENIRNNIHKLKMQECRLENMERLERFDYLNLSNIFEYMPLSAFYDIAYKLISNLPRGAGIAYWNLMVPRRISHEFPQKAHFNETLSSSLSAKDKGFFYDRFIIDTIR